jgi:release factor glutamine methyltransferase
MADPPHEGEGPRTSETLVRPPVGGSRAALVDEIAALVGSVQEARWIVEHGGPRRSHALAARRAAGEPLQYVLGRWPFRSVELTVDRRALIPRPETEQVVQLALAELRTVVAASGGGGPAQGDSGPPGSGPVCVDLGTGTGAIALSLALECGPTYPGLQVWATDASADALALAGQNLIALADADPAAAARVRMAEGSWFEALPAELAGQVDLVVANPPYVAETDYPDLDPTVRLWEPRGALVAADGVGGVGGMADIEAIVAEAPGWLRRPGSVVIEIAPDQAEASVEAARRAGSVEVITARDLAGRTRTLVARW